MKIEVYCLANNEEKIMPYFMRHYSQFADVIILENNSTDKTIEIAESMGATVWKYKVPDEINDQWYLDVKGSCWKKSKADWVIVCDADEFVYHPNLVKILEETKSTIFLPRLFNMMTEVFPTGDGQIYDEVQYGREGGAKMNLFKPSDIVDINYAIGCHHARPTGNVQLNVTSEIVTLHMRHLSRAYALARNKYLFSRLSDLNKRHKWGYHFGPDKGETWVDYEKKYNLWFNNESTVLIKVL